MQVTEREGEEGELVSLSVRIPRWKADRLKEIADAAYQSVAARIRLLIDVDIEADDRKGA